MKFEINRKIFTIFFYNYLNFFPQSIEAFNQQIVSYINFHKNKGPNYDLEGNNNSVPITSEDLIQFESQVF